MSRQHQIITEFRDWLEKLETMSQGNMLAISNLDEDKKRKLQTESNSIHEPDSWHKSSNSYGVQNWHS